MSALTSVDRIVLALATHRDGGHESLVDIAAVAGLSPGTVRRHIGQAPVSAGHLQNTFGLTPAGHRLVDVLTAPLRELMPMDRRSAARVLLAVQRSTARAFMDAAAVAPAPVETREGEDGTR